MFVERRTPRPLGRAKLGCLRVSACSQPQGLKALLHCGFYAARLEAAPFQSNSERV